MVLCVFARVMCDYALEAIDIVHLFSFNSHDRSKTASDSVQRDGFPSAIGNQCWSGLKSFAVKEEKSGSTLRKTLFILKRSDGLRDFAVFESVFDHFRDADRKYVFEITSAPVALRDQTMMVHLMSRKEIKIAAVELVEKFGE